MNLTHSYSSIKLYENCPYRYYHQRVAKTVVDKGGEASQHGERVHKHLEDRLRDKVDLPQELKHVEPLVNSFENLSVGGDMFAELEMTLTKDLTPTSWWGDDAWMRSKLDVYIIKNQKAVVADWKTGKRRPDFFQLELFALQVFAHYLEVQSVTSSFVWLKDMAMDKKTYTRNDTARLWDKMLGKVQRIEQSVTYDNWPAKPSGLCNYCPCKSFCEYV